MEKEAIKKQITDYLKAREEVMSAYIFGSFVQRQVYHDIDVAVCLYGGFEKNDFKKFPYGYESLLISELSALTKRKIDFVVMNNAEILIQQRIVNNGILLFTRDDGSRIAYENHVRAVYIDTEHLRKIQKHYLAKKIDDA